MTVAHVLSRSRSLCPRVFKRLRVIQQNLPNTTYYILIQACDFYNCTAAKYALDAGHTAILELLGAGEAADIYMTVDLNEMTPSMGLWVRYMDPQSELAYVMNDETGELRREFNLAEMKSPPCVFKLYQSR